MTRFDMEVKCRFAAKRKHSGQQKTDILLLHLGVLGLYSFNRYILGAFMMTEYDLSTVLKGGNCVLKIASIFGKVYTD